MLIIRTLQERYHSRPWGPLSARPPPTRSPGRKVRRPNLLPVPLIPIVLLLLAAALIAAQLAVQSDQLLLSLLLIGPVLPALVLAHLRSAPGRLAAARARSHSGQGIR